MSLTFQAAQARYQKKFPHNELIEFRGVNQPCVIKCSIHGTQSSTSFTSISRSKHGCPVCGLEATKSKRHSEAVYREIKANRQRVKEYLSQLRTLISEDAAPEDFKSLAMSYASKI